MFSQQNSIHTVGRILFVAVNTTYKPFSYYTVDVRMRAQAIVWGLFQTFHFSVGLTGRRAFVHFTGKLSIGEMRHTLVAT